MTSLLIVMTVLTVVRGQDSGQPAGDGAAPGIVVSPGEDHRIGPGDVVEIQVNLAPEISTQARVNSDGIILVPVIGRIRAQQKTSEELSEEIAARLKEGYLKAPIVKVVIKQIYSRTYLIQGAVRQPGVYQVEGQVSLLELLTVSGGLAENHGTTAFIIRRIKNRTPAPAIPTSVHAVAPEEPVAPAENAESSSSSPRASATPSFEMLKANISGLLKGNFEQNRHLEPGDLVNIPTSDVFFVAGEVRAPSSYPFKDGTTLRQAVSLAQGMTPKASGSGAVIYREDDHGQRYEIKVNLDDVMHGKAKDMDLKPNDVVVVPNSTLKSAAIPVLSAFGSGVSLALGGRL